MLPIWNISTTAAAALLFLNPLVVAAVHPHRGGNLIGRSFSARTQILWGKHGVPAPRRRWGAGDFLYGPLDLRGGSEALIEEIGDETEDTDDEGDLTGETEDVEKEEDEEEAAVDEDEDDIYDDDEDRSGSDDGDASDSEESSDGVVDITEDDGYDVEESDVEESDDTDADESAAVVTPARKKTKGSPLSYRNGTEQPTTPNPLHQMGLTVYCFLLLRKVDVNSPVIIMRARWAYIAYLFAVQLFVLYVKFRARRIDNRFPVAIESPLAGLVKGRLGGESGAAGGVAELASRFLSSPSTVRDYDVSQANALRNGALLPMAFNWFIHFKWGQVQPLVFQASSGVFALVHHPLFQAYVLGRDLERPFKTPPNPMAANLEKMKEEAEKGGTAGEEADAEVEDEDESEEEDDSAPTVE